jgi:tetratricopeptide (TPR) repeat protein
MPLISVAMIFPALAAAITPTPLPGGLPEVAPARRATARHPASGAKELADLGDRLMQQSRDRLAPALYAEAASAYLQALALDPRSTRALLGLAWVKNSRHEFAEGRRWAETALAIDPDLPDAFALLGDAEVELGDYDAAFTHYQRALDLRPDLSSYSRAAHLLWLTGQADRGIELMRRAIRSGGPAPENTAWCRAQLALMVFHTGNAAAAEEIVQDGLRLSPQSAHLLNAAGRILAARGQFDAAIQPLEKSAALAPTHEAFSLLADLYALVGRDADAYRARESVEAFHREHAAGHGEPAPGTPAGLASVHGSAQLALFLADHDERRLPEALREAEAAYAATPNVFAADALAWCRLRNGQPKAAAEAIASALRWNTPVAELHFHAGMIFAALDDAPRALSHLSRALSLNPGAFPSFTRQAQEQVRRLQALSSRAATAGPSLSPHPLPDVRS